jgi:hypothetical protein
MWAKFKASLLRDDSSDNRDEIADAEHRLEDAHAQISQALRRNVAVNLNAFCSKIHANATYAERSMCELRTVDVRAYRPLDGTRHGKALDLRRREDVLASKFDLAGCCCHSPQRRG